MAAFLPTSVFFGRRPRILGHYRDNSFSSTRHANCRRPCTQPTPTRIPCQATWVKQSATVIVEAPPDEVYDVYKDIQEMPNWSPWLKEVRVDPNDGMLSQWVLFSRGIEISWKARITTDSRGDMIAWRSESGLTNRGSVKFKGMQQRDATATSNNIPRSSVTLTIEFDVPDFLAQAFDNNFIGRFVRDTLFEDLKRFRGAVLRRRRQRRMDSTTSRKR